MKREEREYAEIVPEATRKARLEQQANTLLDLPKDVRKMIMIRLKPIDMYVLYSGVDNYAFKKWCDDYFWDYAFRQLFPNVTPEANMVHPRWRFFAYALAALDVQPSATLRFIDMRQNYVNRDTIRVILTYDARFVVHVEEEAVNFGTFIINMYIRHYDSLPVIERLENLLRVITFSDTELLPALFYEIFRRGYKLHVLLRPGQRFFLGCHICGSPAVTGYSAEDPSKLLCGPSCTALKK